MPIITKEDLDKIQDIKQQDHSCAIKKYPPISINFKTLKTISVLKKKIADEIPLNDQERIYYQEHQELVHAKEFQIKL